MVDHLVVSGELSPSGQVLNSIEEFLDRFVLSEIQSGGVLSLYHDQKSDSYYVICHLDGNTLADNADLDASLDGEDEDEIYKLNREITEDQLAYIQMQEDAIGGRSFEDLVIEYDTTYNSDLPLKVYGGQHRIHAITIAKENGKNLLHGVRVYFDLSREQKVEIATVNNTSIAVSNDLLDRMREQLLGSELRDWGQETGLLAVGTDFSDKRAQDVLTVRVARTLVVNYFRGSKADLSDFHEPIVCKSGGLDEDYMAVRSEIDWSDKSLIEMGQQFTRLHSVQSERVRNRDQDSYAEYARKAHSLSVVASWGYAAGLFQSDSSLLKHLYELPESVKEPSDPLNAKGLSNARLKGVDPDTYRGLGTRYSAGELGRMLELFILLATKASRKRVTLDLANAAIQSYEAKRAQQSADRALGKI